MLFEFVCFLRVKIKLEERATTKKGRVKENGMECGMAKVHNIERYQEGYTKMIMKGFICHAMNFALDL